ncbi:MULTISPECIES: TPM domain-containing protein [Novosphingobium]|uniref:TPM domain-containing protein n=2 Tax=Novosphingobium TaxID=165696 RepID=A0ABT2I7Y1_9SPHN|nr:MULTISPECIES: TPM domain-containing protein [Novosphingobium]MCT2400916.1 TPM domain-containing protein [Novosphingobium mangrovi (ex Huang et al. 2023)]
MAALAEVSAVVAAHLAAAAHLEAGEMILSNTENQQVADAIHRAEIGTSGEILCVLSEADSYYPHVALGWAAAIALLIPYLLWLTGINIGMMMPPGWQPGHWEDAMTIAYHRFGLGYTVLPIALFIVTYGLTLVPPVSRFLTPQRVRRKHVHNSALEQFRAMGLRRTARRTGVLIFVSLSDRQVEVIADEGIYTRVPPDAWADAVAAIITGVKRKEIATGLVEAVERVGTLLATHFPPSAENPNELPDKVIEL